MWPANSLAGTVALFAFGAIFTAFILLLLLNPHSRAVRWFAVFTFMLLAWLLLQGLLLLDFLSMSAWQVYQAIVHMLPATFLAAMLARVAPDRTRLPYVPIGYGLVALLALGMDVGSWFSVPWHAVHWGLPVLFYVRRPWTQGSTSGGRRLGTILGGVVPVAVLGSVLLEGGFVLYVLPLLSVLIYLLLFYGIVRHRYYDIEVRAARTGELAAAAAEQDRLAMLGEIAATVAHEVRNPLTGIQSLTQLIAQGPIDDEKRGRYTEVILSETARLERLVTNLTGLAKRTADNAQNTCVQLDILYADLMLLVEPRARRAGVSVRAEAMKGTINGPREALAQAMINLAINAIAHSPPGGVVTLGVQEQQDRVLLSVRDQGRGVPSKQRQRIFEPFQTTGGTGLGLAVVRRLATDHGWLVEVADAPSGGAEFRLSIPRSTDDERLPLHEPNGKASEDPDRRR